MSRPPQGLRHALPSVMPPGTTMAPLWRMGRSRKSSSTPRTFSTEVTPCQPQASLPPCHFPHHHGRGCLVFTVTSVTPIPRHWGVGRAMGWALSRQSLSLGGQSGPGRVWTAVGVEGSGLGVWVPILVPAAQGRRPAQCPAVLQQHSRFS